MDTFYNQAETGELPTFSFINPRWTAEYNASAK